MPKINQRPWKTGWTTTNKWLNVYCPPKFTFWTIFPERLFCLESLGCFYFSPNTLNFTLDKKLQSLDQLEEYQRLYPQWLECWFLVGSLASTDLEDERYPGGAFLRTCALLWGSAAFRCLLVRQLIFQVSLPLQKTGNNFHAKKLLIQHWAFLFTLKKHKCFGTHTFRSARN